MQLTIVHRCSDQLRLLLQRYPLQFWLLFAGFVVNRASNGLIWPFLTIYVREQSGAPLSHITALFTLEALTGLLATAAIGPVMDRFGRKPVMALSLLGSGALLVAMREAHTLQAWALLLAIYGMVLPAFTIGAHAMVADVVPEVQRPSAYALMRIAQNVGVAVGPAVGGFLVVSAYGLTYLIAAAVNAVLGILVVLLLAETLPARAAAAQRGSGGYVRLLRDRAFVVFIAVLLLVEMIITLVFVLLPVYAKENFGVLENQYGLIVTINAVMVVLFQYSMTRFTQRFRPLTVIAAGALVYAVGSMTIALGSAFAAFAFSMVIVTIGELMVAPTGLALTARLAPHDMRARYMGVYSITYTMAAGIAPLIGGQLNDRIGPAAIWYGGLVLGVAAAAGFFFMQRACLLPDEPAPTKTKRLLTASQAQDCDTC